MSWTDRVAFRQVFGGGLMLLSIGLAGFLVRNGEITVNGLILVMGILAAGGIVFDTKAFVEFIKAIPWPWRRSDGA